MRVPTKRIGDWAKELIDVCSASKPDRILRGTFYRNMYLTGDENGNPQTYNKSFAYIDNLSSFIYSPVELRYAIERYGAMGPLERAKCRAAASFLHQHISGASVDTVIEQAVTWALVKGKTLVETLWEPDGDGAGEFKPYLVQPEVMGVEREDISDLDRQEAFYKVSFLSLDQFGRLVENHPDEKKLRKTVLTYIDSGKTDETPGSGDMLKQVILGGLNPYQEAGSQKNKGRGVVDWLGGPVPTFAPRVLQKIVALYDLWVWDDKRKDWTTIQIVGPDCVVLGNDVHLNAFADDPKTMFDGKNLNNPLKGHHPFQEICPNPLADYFWGRSELCNTALLQKNINVRLDGINSMLRRQEKPSTVIKGATGINQTAIAKLNKPGGWLADSAPNLDVQQIAPEIPSGVYESLQESERHMDEMAGFPNVMRGKGESGVRSQGHAQTLTTNASPRFKDRALLVERQVGAIGGLGFDLLKAKTTEKLVAWVDPKHAGPEGTVPAMDPTLEPPVPGMVAVEFMLSDIEKACKVSVDAHSGSPAFSHDARQLLFDLDRIGAVSPEHVLEHTDVPGKDEAISELETKNAANAAFLAQHPEAAGKGGAKKH